MLLSDDDECSSKNVVNGSGELLSNRMHKSNNNNHSSRIGDSISDTQISFLTRDCKNSDAKNSFGHNATLSQLLIPSTAEKSEVNAKLVRSSLSNANISHFKNPSANSLKS
jgi:hypothetical protein